MEERVEAGADAFAAFTSVIQTFLKEGTPTAVVEALAGLFRGPDAHLTPG